MASDLIGVLPAAGRGSRLLPFRYPKELLPVAFEPRRDPPGGLQPRVVSECAIEAFVLAGVTRCLLIVAPWKLEVVSYFGGGEDFGVEIAYLCQEEARGLPHALELARPWTADGHVAFAMPDTIAQPRDCLAQLWDLYRAQSADLALGLFPTDEAERLGPVLTEGEVVLSVYDKCPRPPVQNTWGVAIWGPAFTELLHCGVQQNGAPGPEPVLGSFFDLAVRLGMRVRAMFFAEGAYADLGTPHGIQCCLQTALVGEAVR
jgi:glucose-1-phosphate thymidylyltransferase